MNNFKVSHICLANAFRDESNKDYRYGKRHEKFVELMKYFNDLNDHKPVVVSIKELRKCKDPTGEIDWESNDILNNLAVSGRYAIADCQPVKIHNTNGVNFYNPFYLGQLYDSRKLYKIESKIIHYYLDMYDTPENAPNMGGSYLYVRYAFKDSNGIPDLKRTFSIGTVHFPLQQTHKLISAKYFSEKASMLPDILIGDFNLFKDDSLYSEIYEELTKKFIDVITNNLTDQNAQLMYGTFFPFPHDKPPIPILYPYLNKQKGIECEPSHLDYVFTSKTSLIKCIGCQVLTKTFNPLNKDEIWSYDETTFPISDHLPLISNFLLDV